MSNPFAIAAVTATFSQLLAGVNEDPSLAGASVSTLPPDLARPPSETGRQLNLFLYEVAPNGAWRNADAPFRNATGDLVSRPVLALDLHYLLTAYGQNDDDLDGHHLLAHAMSLVHDQAVFGRDQIRAALNAQAAVAQSDLADQVELVKVCPIRQTLEEKSLLWSAFEASYRLSVTYEASVVLIERPRPTRVAPPVRAASLRVLPFRRPVVESVAPQVVAPGATLTIRGRNLSADHVSLRLGTLTAPVATADDREITATLPADLPAGVNTVQVVHQLDLGDPATPHRGFESNVAAFILAPQITTPPPISVAPGALLQLSFSPPVARAQRVSILIGDREIVLGARPPSSPPATSLAFPIPDDFPTGTFLLRLRVDGAESPLSTDPNTHEYVGPTVTIA